MRLARVIKTLLQYRSCEDNNTRIKWAKKIEKLGIRPGKTKYICQEEEAVSGINMAVDSNLKYLN